MKLPPNFWPEPQPRFLHAHYPARRGWTRRWLPVLRWLATLFVYVLLLAELIVGLVLLMPGPVR